MGKYNRFLLINSNDINEDNNITKRWPAVKFAVILIPSMIVLNINCAVSSNGKKILKIKGILKSQALLKCLNPITMDIGIVINIEVIIVNTTNDIVSIILTGINGKLDIIIKNDI